MVQIIIIGKDRIPWVIGQIDIGRFLGAGSFLGQSGYDLIPKFFLFFEFAFIQNSLHGPSLSIIYNYAN